LDCLYATIQEKSKLALHQIRNKALQTKQGVQLGWLSYHDNSYILAGGNFLNRRNCINTTLPLSLPFLLVLLKMK
jgi:hypothetical protein